MLSAELSALVGVAETQGRDDPAEALQRAAVLCLRSSRGSVLDFQIWQSPTPIPRFASHSRESLCFDQAVDGHRRKNQSCSMDVCPDQKHRPANGIDFHEILTAIRIQIAAPLTCRWLYQAVCAWLRPTLSLHRYERVHIEGTPTWLHNAMWNDNITSYSQ